MSLIPYHPREGREIVLRHHNAIVVRDPSSHRLEIRGLQLTECPTCHQPLRSTSPERHYDDAVHRETYVNPDYFRMLRAASEHLSHDSPPPSSPIRRLVEPVTAATPRAPPPAPPPAPGRIRPEAFSPNYFHTFFVEERELGRGGKGVVLLVRHVIDGCHLGHFACKRVPVGDDHGWLEKVLVEVELLAKLSHPNLVSYRHVWLEDVQLTRFGPSVACAFILQQYCNGGDLLRYVVGEVPREATKEQLKAQMRRRSKSHMDRPPPGLFAATQRRLPFEDIYSLFKDITSGIAYLHEANYIHRDLKPSNCLLHQEGKNMACLISDFGEVQAEKAVRKSTGSTGTISYCAPEVLKRDPSTGGFGNFTTKSDMFSLGMILYFLCFGQLPYRSANAMQEELEDIDLLRAEITDWKGFEDEKRERPDLPAELYQLLKKLLAVDPAERPSASKVLSAMKPDPGPDGGVTRARSTSPPLGLGSRRVQSVDSPLTPRADAARQARVNAADDDAAPDPAGSDTLLAHHHHHRAAAPDLGSPRYRGHGGSSHAMALSLSHDRRSSASRPPSPAALAAMPLLLPPPPAPAPTTLQAALCHGAALTRYWLGRHAAGAAFAARLALFVVKVLALGAACWPYGVAPGLGAGLVVLAGLDLGGGRPSAEGRGRAPPRLLLLRGDEEQREDLGGRWRTSALLVVLHFAVLAVAARWGRLCAVPVGRPVLVGWREW
ncbi:hypothetical protein P8C59_008306 [Phyllachora maydis]|uniref:non-specific serine/threonine protein kinase n=1 Tax=Phyllachora maydis TaxID=1825666 RepID=A0AAD9MEF8_9PEZI|nr:hypothetical protein P8C59_008306 [Phyllachora maydis]